MQRYLDESRTAQEEYGRWVEVVGHWRIGKPGFFGRYAAGMGKDWQIYYISDAPSLESTNFAEADRVFGGVWFAPPPADIPTDICVITRDVDAAFLDLFFRDEWMYRLVFDAAIRNGMGAEPFRNRLT